MLTILFAILLILSWVFKAPLWVLALLGVATLVTNPTFYGDKKYKKALKCEKNKAYKEACRLYVEAILKDSIAAKECKKRFLNLWSEFGPFDYRKDIEAKTAELLKGIEKEDEESKHCSESGVAVWIRTQDIFLQSIDVLLGKKDQVEPLKEVTVLGKTLEFKSMGPVLRVGHGTSQNPSADKEK